MTYPEIAAQLIQLKNADLNLRTQLVEKGTLSSDGYNTEMEQLHIRNAEALDAIIRRIGYPTISKVGKEGSEAAWLIIQHAISLPPFMKRCLALLEEAVKEGEASQVDLAYLSDRIAGYENKEQLYGTQYDWDDDGLLSPRPYDDITKVNDRRKTIGLNTLEDQTDIMRRRAEAENDTPPVDLAWRKQKYDKWRRDVGWIAD